MQLLSQHHPATSQKSSNAQHALVTLVVISILLLLNLVCVANAVGTVLEFKADSVCSELSVPFDLAIGSALTSIFL